MMSLFMHDYLKTAGWFRAIDLFHRRGAARPA
jgi:hypothetical protein